jgi:hypothetical protein
LAVVGGGAEGDCGRRASQNADRAREVNGERRRVTVRLQASKARQMLLGC